MSDFEAELRQIEEIRRLQMLMAQEEERIRQAEDRRKEQEAKARKKEAKKKAKEEKERRKREQAELEAAEEAARKKAAQDEAERKRLALERAKAKEAEISKLQEALNEQSEKAAKESERRKREEMARQNLEAARKKANEIAVKRAAAESRYVSLLEAQTTRQYFKPTFTKNKMALLMADGGDKYSAYKLKKATNKNNKIQPLRLLTQKGDSVDATKKLNTGPLFQKRSYKKSPEELAFLREQFQINPSLKGLIPSQVERLVQAFEKVEFPAGTTIAEKGQEDNSLFIVNSGEVNFCDADGKRVGGAGVGRTFGESALTYAGNRTVTVKAGNNKAVLYKLNQEHFCNILRDQIIKSEEERYRLIKNIEYFKNVGGPDLKLLCNAMKPYVFKKGENLTTTFKELPFCCLVHDGTVEIDRRLSPNKSCLGKVIGGSKGGATFGLAFATQNAMAIGGPFKADSICLTDGVAYVIEKKDFENVFGSMEKLEENQTDKEKLAEIKTIKNAKLSDEDLDRLVRQIVDTPFEKGKEIFADNESTIPALYFIRRGQVKIVDKRIRKTEIIMEGRIFGEEHFMMRQGGIPKSVRAYYTATAKKNTILGVLRLHELAALTGKKAYISKKVTIPAEDLIRHRILGEGQYGTVWLVTNKKAEKMEPYALKIQMLDDPTRADPKKCILDEIAVMEEIQSPFVIQVLSTYEEEDSIDMLLSLAPGGELFDVIHQEDKNGEWTSGVGEKNGKFYAMVISDCIAFLHRQKYAFRDLKPENVLIDGDGYPVLTDFGFAKIVEDKTYTFCGTPNYVAPEIISNRGYGMSADNFSLGVLIYETIDGDNPFYEEGMDQTVLYQTIMHEPHYPLAEDQYSAELSDLLNGLLEKDPSKRLGTFREQEIIGHKFFNEYNIDDLRSKKVKAPWVPDPIKLADDDEEED